MCEEREEGGWGERGCRGACGQKKGGTIRLSGGLETLDARVGRDVGHDGGAAFPAVRVTVEQDRALVVDVAALGVVLVQRDEHVLIGVVVWMQSRGVSGRALCASGF
jgi:hypothetical protein